MLRSFQIKRVKKIKHIGHAENIPDIRWFNNVRNEVRSFVIRPIDGRGYVAITTYDILQEPENHTGIRKSNAAECADVLPASGWDAFPFVIVLHSVCYLVLCVQGLNKPVRHLPARSASPNFSGTTRLGFQTSWPLLLRSTPNFSQKELHIIGPLIAE